MKKIVIIDDEPWTRGVIRNLVHWNALGLELIGEATDGETGFELIKKMRPDIVVTDVRMPRLSGIELVKRLREIGLDQPVIIISGYDDYAYVRGALKLGVTDYLLKPIREEELNEQLSRCLAQLKKTQLSNPNTILNAGFFADKWKTQYDSIKEKLTTALYTGNSAIVKKQFQLLNDTLITHEGNHPPLEVLIGAYYAFLLILQNYISSVGMTQKEAFDDHSASFVFGCESTPCAMTHFLCDLYLSALDQYKHIQARKMRLDIDAVCLYLKENYMKNITLEQTAGRFHVTKEYLSKAFKSERHEGFTKHVTALKMKKAYQLITEYDAPLKEVGFMVGYNNQSHFYKTFKKFYGKTPGEIRDAKK